MRGAGPVVDTEEHPDSASGLAADITDVARDYCLVVVTQTGNPPAALVDVARLRAAVNGYAAQVRVLHREQVDRLSKLLPAGWQVYGGAVRVYRPLPAGDPPPPRSHHPLFCVWSAEHGERVLDDIVAVVAAQLTPAYTVESVAGAPTFLRPDGSVLQRPDRWDESAPPGGDDEARRHSHQQRAEEISFELADARRRQQAAEAKALTARGRAREAEQRATAAEWSQAKAERQLQVATDELAELRRDLDASQAREAGLRAQVEELSGRLKELAQRVSAAQAEAAANGQEVSRQRRAAADAAASRDRQTEATREARREARRLADEAAELRRRLYGLQVFADPAAQARHEIHLAWLATVPEPQRAALPLRDYQFGSDFLTDLDQLAVAQRTRAIEVAVDVLTRRAASRAGRQVRQLGDGRAAGLTGQLVRRDGATAWRCNMQDDTPQARRLLWWELPDGTVELGRVALHDDMTLI